jgi:hypothetical protein
MALVETKLPNRVHEKLARAENLEDLLEKLRDRYRDSDRHECQKLERKLQDLQRERGEDVKTYLHRAERLWKQLEDYKSTTTEANVTLKMVQGLNIDDGLQAVVNLGVGSMEKLRATTIRIEEALIHVLRDTKLTVHKSEPATAPKEPRERNPRNPNNYYNDKGAGKGKGQGDRTDTRPPCRKEMDCSELKQTGYCKYQHDKRSYGAILGCRDHLGKKRGEKIEDLREFDKTLKKLQDEREAKFQQRNRVGESTANADEETVKKELAKNDFPRGS